LPYDETVADLGPIEAAVKDFNPKMITAVHCETPSGTLNPIDGIGELKRRHGVPLLYVDAVSSIGGTPVSTDEWGVDLCLGGSQKCLSSTPGMAFLSVSDAAWEIVDGVDYVGYDALKPFQTAQQDFYFPYTPNWQGTAMLDAGAGRILDEGLEACFGRHRSVAENCRSRLAEMGLSLFPAPGAVSSPTVTAAKLPEGVAWPDLDAALRKEGLVVGGSYGPMAGKVFRIGHMGSQADPDRVSRAMDVLEGVLARLR
jgi:aspartate aminotransferase-like enzyme